jgi:hypothetical protein
MPTKPVHYWKKYDKMTKFFLSYALICLAALCAWGQKPGMLASDERYRNVPLLPAYSGVKYTEVPVKVSLKKFCPVPGDQRQTGACVGWAVGYGALTIHRAVASKLSEQAVITAQANSSAFLYNQVKQSKSDCSEGAYIEDALEVLKHYGDCLERSFNYETRDCHEAPDDAVRAEALQYRIQDFAAVFALNEDPKSKIGKTCKILATQTPLVVGVGVTKSFFEVLPGAVIWNPSENEEISGYHAMVAVGYNNVEKYVELLNSFGPSWGQNGFIRLAFDDFERLCRYAYVIVPDQRSGIAAASETGSGSAGQISVDAGTTLSGEFVFRQPAGFVTTENGEELMYFEEIKTQKLQHGPGGQYGTDKPSFKVGDVFQLVARQIPRGRFVYVFSQSPDGTLNQHFPRKKERVATASFVLDKTVEIVIPNEESLLQLPMRGEDALCIVYSQAPIPDYEQRLQGIEQGQASFPDKVALAFKDVMIDPENVQFLPEKMSFSAVSDPAKGKIAALIMLTVVAE